MKALREDQNEALDQLRSSIGGGERRICMQAPTGFGKTVLAAQIVENARAKKKKLLFTVPALSLIDQTVEMFYAQKIYDVGVIQANHHMTDWSQPVQVASVQTLMKGNMPSVDIMLIDECHRWFKWYEQLLPDPAMANIPIIGLSATPWTKGLGAYYHELIIANTTQGLIDAGLLSDFKVFAPSHPDLTNVPTVAGDYHEGKLSAAMQEGTLTADVVQTWLKHGERRPTLCYAVDLLHARKLQEQFKAAGVRCGYVDANVEVKDKHTKTGEFREGRETVKRKFHTGEYEVVVSVGTLTTGIDWDVRCISLVRPTKSQMLFVQIIGRGLRTAPPGSARKDHCLILDHSDNHSRLGFVTDIDASHTELHNGKTPNSDTTDRIRLPKECPQCSYMKPPGTAKCPVCAYVAVAHSKIEPTAGELAEIKRKAKAPYEFKPETFFAQLRRHAIQRGYKPGWAAMKYKDKFGKWPPRAWEGHEIANFIAPEVLSWIKSEQIRWAKGKAKQFQRPTASPLSTGTLVSGTLCTEDDLREFR